MIDTYFVTFLIYLRLRDNGSGLNEVCLAQLFKFTDTLYRRISFKPLLWDVFLKISGGKSLNH